MEQVEQDEANKYTEIDPDELDEDAKEVQMEIVRIKEKKVVKTRNSRLAHQIWPSQFSRNKLAFYLSMGFGRGTYKNVDVTFSIERINIIRDFIHIFSLCMHSIMCNSLQGLAAT